MENNNYSFPSDIWSLGMVAYEMATGGHAYQTTNPYELYQALKNLPCPTLKNNPNVSPEFQDFVSKCLLKEPQKRSKAADLYNHKFI